MQLFSDESALLIRNWETVRDILNAEKQLRKELNSCLVSLEKELVRRQRLINGWVFVKHADNQVYISNKKWVSENQYIVWIGVEYFNPDNVFGNDIPPNLYIWTPRKHYDLAKELIEQLQESDFEIYGDVDNREKSGYIVRYAVRKYLEEEDLDEYVISIRSQILEFMTHYMDVLDKLNSVIEKYI